MNYLYVVIVILLFVSCNKKHEIKSGVDVSMKYNIDHKLYIIRNNMIDQLLSYKLKEDFSNIPFNEDTFLSHDTLNIVQFDNHFHVVKNIFSNKFLILITGYYQTKLTDGQIIRPYKSIYLYNLETGIALEVSNKSFEGSTSIFHFQNDKLIIKQINDPSYDLIDFRFTEKGREKSKKYSYLVINLDDFSIVDEINSQKILSKVVL